MNKEFRFRGENQTRLETFSDAVFALAITLLVVSNDVPNNFDEMVKVFVDFIPFALCMSLIVYIWYEHFLFFIRFGFRNRKIVLLNSLLLFLILFYVYPLKFLAKILVGLYIGPLLKLLNLQNYIDSNLGDMINSMNQMSTTMIIYGLFGSAIFFLMASMYKYALNRKKELKLNEIEIHDTIMSYKSMIIMGSIPFLSVLLASIFHNHILGGILGGFTYWLYIPIFIISNRTSTKKRQKLVQLKKQNKREE